MSESLTSGPPALAFDRVNKRYLSGQTAVCALQDVSFSVAPASIVGVIGASGAGKSTVFRCASALELPDSGAVRLAGDDLTTLDGVALRAARRKVGLVFQQLHLLPSRTVYENVVFPLELAKRTSEEDRRRASDLLDWVGLLDRGESYPKILSGGQRQRVAIARALATSPALLLCDEPTSALDPSTTQTIVDLLRRARDELGVAVLVITHEMKVVRDLCDHVIVLDEGRVVNAGAPDDVLESRRGDHVERPASAGRSLRSATFPRSSSDIACTDTLL